MKAKGPQEQKRYVPSNRVKGLLEEKLRLLQEGESSRNWDRKKVDFLDRLFQSYADLIYFLETTATNPELYEAFKKDLDDFFDYRDPTQVKQLHPEIGVGMDGVRITETSFARLIFASILPTDDIAEKNFQKSRLKLVNLLQSMIYAKMWFILQNSFGESDQVTKSALQDLSSSVGWTAMMWKIGYQESGTYPRRILDFPSPYAKDMK